ncbi:MAG: hypothetical protein AAGG48_30095 [Planctomycetota bacterium]
MVKIVVTEDQAKAIATAKEGVEFVDADGNRLGFFAHPFNEDDISIAQERAASDEPRRTTQQVIDRLKSLEKE